MNEFVVSKAELRRHTLDMLETKFKLFEPFDVKAEPIYSCCFDDDGIIANQKYRIGHKNIMFNKVIPAGMQLFTLSNPTVPAYECKPDQAIIIEKSFVDNSDFFYKDDLLFTYKLVKMTDFCRMYNEHKSSNPLLIREYNELNKFTDWYFKTYSYFPDYKVLRRAYCSYFENKKTALFNYDDFMQYYTYYTNNRYLV